MASTYIARHVSVSIDRPPNEVYAFASDPANLPAWAKGLSGSIEHVGGEWVADSPMGRVVVRFTAPNEHGVLDHDVVLASGETFHNAMRVVPNGSGSEVVFTLLRRDGTSEAEFDADTAAVAADLAALKRLLQR